MTVPMRAAVAGDLPALRDVYRRAVLGTGPARYDARQVAMWAGFADDETKWPALLEAPWLRVAEHDGGVVGFLCLNPLSHVSLLFVEPASQRLGVASDLLRAARDFARAEGVALLTADASLIVVPVFERAGFAVRQWEDVEREGVQFRRARMECVLS
jgi:putative acetyltransferase